MLFQKKKPNDVLPVTIDLNEDHFVLNGKQFKLPVRISELTEILGEPRIVSDRNKDVKAYKERICEKYDLSPEKYALTDYYWDDLGLLASTFEKKTVHSLIVKLGDSKKYPMDMPKYDFSGTLTVRGKNWQDIVEESAVTSGTFKLKLGTLHAYVVRYGKKVKDTKQFQLSLNDDQKLEFFDASE